MLLTLSLFNLIQTQNLLTWLQFQLVTTIWGKFSARVRLLLFLLTDLMSVPLTWSQVPLSQRGGCILFRVLKEKLWLIILNPHLKAGLIPPSLSPAGAGFFFHRFHNITCLLLKYLRFQFRNLLYCLLGNFYLLWNFIFILTEFWLLLCFWTLI